MFKRRNHKLGASHGCSFKRFGSRKVPIKGVDFSSQSFGASLEIEISSANASVVQSQLAQLYASLNLGIDAQIAAASQNSPAQMQPAMPAPSAVVHHRNGISSTNRIAGSSNGKKITTSEAQQRAIYAICKAQNLELAAVLADYNVTDARELYVRDASTLIDQLKARPAAR